MTDTLGLQERSLAGSGGDASDASHSDDHSVLAGAQEMAVIFLALGVGIVCKTALRKTRIPYTVLLLIFGILMGILDKEGLAGDGTMHASINIWVHVDPHVLLFCFLPVLIFESAFSTDYHIFSREASQVLTLAIPGVILSSVMTAGIAYGIFPYGWSWNACMMFGAMMSATDPVAVVALMKELGVSERLATLMEGESLFNDGTSIVVFEVFKDALTGVVQRDAGELIVFFLRLALGGAATGIAVGLACVTGVSYILHDDLAETSITIVGSFGAFMVAEATGFHFSGVIAVVVTGFLMSHLGKSRFSPGVEHNLHAFWMIAGYVANTVIFFISGLIMSQKSFYTETIKAADWGYLIALYALLHVVRFAMLGVCWYALSHLGYGLSWQQGAALCFGGLRGAVGLTLALIVEDDMNIDDTTKSHVVFHMSGIALLTLLINGTVMEYVLKALGLTRVSDERLRLLRRGVRTIEDACNNKVAEMKENDRFLRDVDWSIVYQYLPVHSQEIYDERKQKIQNKRNLMPPRLRGRWRRYEKKYGDTPKGKRRVSINSKIQNIKMLPPMTSRALVKYFADDEDGGQPDIEMQKASPDAEEAKKDGPQAEGRTQKDRSGKRTSLEVTLANAAQAIAMAEDAKIIGEVRRRYICMLKSKLWHLFEHGYLSGSALNFLVDTCDEAVDEADHPLSMWVELEDALETGYDRKRDFLCDTQSIGRKILELPGLGNAMRKMIHHRLEFLLQVAMNFIRAHEQASREVVTSLSGDNKEGAEFARRNSVVRMEATREITAAEQWVNRQFEFYPGITRSICTKMAARIILHEERVQIGGLVSSGLLDSLEGKTLATNNTSCQVKLEAHPATMGLPKREELLNDVNFLHDLPQAVFDVVVAQAKERHYRMNDEIITEGEASKGWFVIIRGSCRVVHKHPVPEGGKPEESEEFLAFMGRGRTVGALGTVTYKNSGATVIANSIVHVFFFEAEKMRSLMAEYKSFNDAVWRSAGAFVAETFVPDLADVKSTVIKQFIMSSTVTTYGTTEDIRQRSLRKTSTKSIEAQKEEGKDSKAAERASRPKGNMQRRQSWLEIMHHSARMSDGLEVADSASPSGAGYQERWLPMQLATTTHGLVMAGTVWSTMHGPPDARGPRRRRPSSTSGAASEEKSPAAETPAKLFKTIKHTYESYTLIDFTDDKQWFAQSGTVILFLTPEADSMLGTLRMQVDLMATIRGNALALAGKGDNELKNKHNAVFEQVRRGGVKAGLDTLLEKRSTQPIHEHNAIKMTRQSSGRNLRPQLRGPTSTYAAARTPTGT